LDRLRNIRLDLEYDGTAYSGWQIQKNSLTIEANVRDSLATILAGERVSLVVAGRTDAGVHARQQVVNFRTRSSLPCSTFCCGMNALLPPDIAIRRAKEVPIEWNARYDAIERHYRYRILMGHPRGALTSRFVTQVCYPLDLDIMRTAARYFLGEHDFSAFRSVHCGADNPVRTILRASVQTRGRLLTIDLVGNAFLRNMVRVIVGTLIEVARGRLSPYRVREILEGRQRAKAGPTAPPQGLILWAIKYPPTK